MGENEVKFHYFTALFFLVLFSLQQEIFLRGLFSYPSNRVTSTLLDPTNRNYLYLINI